PPEAVGEFGFDPRTAGGGVTVVLSANPPSRAQALTVPIALEDVDTLRGSSIPPDDLASLIAEALLGPDVLATAQAPTSQVARRLVLRQLTGGSHGKALTATDYEADQTFSDYQNNPINLPQRGLVALESIDDISIVAVPGASTGWVPGSTDQSTAQAINN